MKTKRKLIRQQLDARLETLRPLRDFPLPPRGWIRALRDALGMSGRQLADRLGVTKQREARIEKDEMEGALSLKTLRRVAEALDCVFVYGLVPRTSLEGIVRDRAQRVARERIEQANQTMQLEDQGLSEEEKRAALEEMAEDLVRAMPASLWDGPR